MILPPWVRVMFLRVSLHLLRRFPVYVAFPRSEYYQRIRLPLQHLPFSGMVHVVRHTQLAYAPSQDRSGSLRFLNASFSEPAVLSDPAAVSSHLASSGDLLLPSSHYDSVGLRIPTFTRLHRFTCVTARSSLVPTLSSCRYLHKPKARFPVGRLVPLAGAGITPAGSIRLGLTHRSEGRRVSKHSSSVCH